MNLRSAAARVVVSSIVNACGRNCPQPPSATSAVATSGESTKVLNNITLLQNLWWLLSTATVQFNANYNEAGPADSAFSRPRARASRPACENSLSCGDKPKA